MRITSLSTMLLFAVCQTVLAVDWANPGAGDWNDGTNWSGGVVPSSVGAVIENGGTAQISSAVPNVNVIEVGATVATTGFVEQSGGSITSTGAEIGRFGTGTYTQSGGSLTLASGTINVGGISGNGFYNMSGAATSLTVSNGNFFVGEFGTGTFNMEGGTINQSVGEFRIGSDTSGGNSGDGTFHQSGGTVNANTYMHLGRLGSTGVYNLSGATSVLNVANRLMLGESNGNGTLNMSGGTLNLLNTSMDVLHIGGSGTGTFNQTGGDVNVGGWVHVGRASGTGVYNFSGGSFDISSVGKALFIGESGSGTLNIIGSAGTMTVRNFDLRASDDTLRYTLDNGGVTQINVTDNIQAFAGNLDVDLAGGAALLTSSSHTLISSNTFTSGDSSIFSEALWNKTTGANFVQVDLKPSEEKPTFDYQSPTGPFAPANQGWVTITGLPVGGTAELQLDIETDALLSDLIDYLNDNGHDAALSVAGEPFDVMLSFEPTASESILAWDFSDFDAINNTTTTVSNIVGIPEPRSIMLWLLLGLIAAGACAWQRGRQRKTMIA